MYVIRVSLIALVAATAGCATDYPQVDAALGKSQAQMVTAQTLNPQAVAHPPATAPALADGQRMANVLAAHRKDVSQGNKDVSQPQQFDVGTQGP